MRESHHIIAARVGARLKELRGGLTQQEFAARLGLSQAQYNRYETGKRLAPDAVLEGAARELGLSVEALVWGGAAPAADAASERARAVAELMAELDQDSREDLYLFLKNKTEDVMRRRRASLEKARAALRALRRAG